jgi:DNA-binding transcriptional MerR regulator
MAHEIAKLMLEYAGTFLERAEAVRVAISVGMPLNEIEEYLDWLDATRGPLPPEPDEDEPEEEKPDAEKQLPASD